ncbi:ornithine cyclodeaminase family protein [Umezawaea endophytica]|uniref:Ornithine cyclodeaminase family protein n=1 Tax=Umezawaea endophytica TaxID=1654476 RepID=A0A9X2VIN1_9PSEU|nr:ornithine cyclodeaminase family protein [Umezawaea endophytica]MCS7477366.1 ornithine cyclodeaminase family protein [Umezawaea endophytica]
MRFLSEEDSAALVTEELAYGAVREALIAAVAPTSTTFPALPAHGSDPRNRFTLKSAASANLAGVKIGSYWPDNTTGPRHNSTIILLDQDTGRVAAVVEAAKVNAYRTAAADAVAANTLANPNATTLTIFGTGHQAFYECQALAKIRALDKINVVARTEANGHAFVAELRNANLPATLTEAEQAVTEADIIVTATTARSPLFEADWVRPGTHVASMGSDAKGKQELPPDLLITASLYCDLPPQSTTIGELQHAPKHRDITAIGHVLTGAAEGRTAPDQTTVFDSSGIALQDLYIATALLGLIG